MRCFFPNFINIKGSVLMKLRSSDDVNDVSQWRAFYYREGGAWGIHVRPGTGGYLYACPLEFNENACEHLEGELCKEASWQDYIEDNGTYVSQETLDYINRIRYGTPLTMDDVKQIIKNKINQGKKELDEYINNSTYTITDNDDMMI